MTQFAFIERLGSILICSQDLNSIMIHFKKHFQLYEPEIIVWLK